jgi:adenine-specific DNA-methyltransferase
MPVLNWIGKEKIVNHHREVPFKVLEHGYFFEDGKGSPDEGNKIIHGDNLEALKALLPEYEGKIKCIYIDPPYNTGNESWVYNDNVNDPKIKKWLGEVVGKESEDFTRHDKWLCMMYPRLKLLHKLLSEDGAIFISIDDNEQANLKLICDEIFGELNFLRNIIWHKRYAASNDSKGIPDVHDFILCYQKTDAFQRNLLPRTAKQDSLYKFDSNDGRGLWRPDNLTVKTYSKDYDYPIKNPKTEKEYYPSNGRCWMSNETQILKWIEEGRIYFGQNGIGAPQLKRYLNEVQNGTVPVSYWSFDEVNHTDGAKKELKNIFSGDKSPFQTPKPTLLIERILQLASDKNTIVLDSYAGSGTTAHAVLNMNKHDGGNRKFILIEMEDYAETITAERIKRVIKGYGEKEGTGGNFHYYTLGLPLFAGDHFEYLNDEVDLKRIKEYLWYSETRMPYHDKKEEIFFLGKKDETAIYFLDEEKGSGTLDYESFSSIKNKASQYIIYASNCLLPEDFMLQKNITFKKIPRDISRF